MNLKSIFASNPDLADLNPDLAEPDIFISGSEESAQIVLFQWVRAAEANSPEYCYVFHVPNGGHRLPSVASRMKAAGVRRGVPDILFPVRRGQYVGLAIELKTGRNRITPHQSEWLAHLRSEGWCAVVCYGAEQAWEALENYNRLGDWPY
jgi:hypothetical protein